MKYFIPFLIITCLSGLIIKMFPNIDPLVVAMLFMTANIVIAVNFGQGPVILSTLLSLFSFDFFFAPPYFAWSVMDSKYWVIYSVMFVVTFIISRLVLQSRRSTEEALSAEMEAERERLISSLLSSVSHDLRIPLTSISGAASTLLEDSAKISGEDSRYLLSMISEESQRLNKLVEKILQITKIESENVSIRKEMHSLEELTGGVLHRFESSLMGRKISIDIPADLAAPLDDILIEQVLVNLIENVIRYTPEESPVDIKAFTVNQNVYLEILDRGPGLPQQDQKHIFEKFYRGDKKNVFGSGLGLAICQGILKIHQGRMGVRNREGGGSVFYFTLPLHVQGGG